MLQLHSGRLNNAGGDGRPDRRGRLLECGHEYWGQILLRSKYYWGQNTAEVRILLRSKYFLGQYSLGVNLAQRLRYFWSQFFTKGKIEMQLLIKACKLFNLWPQLQRGKDVICFFWDRFWIFVMVERGGMQKVDPLQVCWFQNLMAFRVFKSTDCPLLDGGMIPGRRALRGASLAGLFHVTGAFCDLSMSQVLIK